MWSSQHWELSRRNSVSGWLNQHGLCRGKCRGFVWGFSVFNGGIVIPYPLDVRLSSHSSFLSSLFFSFFSFFLFLFSYLSLSRMCSFWLDRFLSDSHTWNAPTAVVMQEVKNTACDKLLQARVDARMAGKKVRLVVLAYIFLFFLSFFSPLRSSFFLVPPFSSFILGK